MSVLVEAAQAEERFLAPVYAQIPFEPISGAGPFLHLADGRAILDLYGGHAVAALGYAHHALLSALNRQSEKLIFQSNAAALKIRAEAAERLLAFTPTVFSKVFFVNSGAEANENALRIALKATRRSHIVAVEGGFHGRTAAAGAVTHGALGKWYGFPRTPFPVSFVPRNDAGAMDRIVDSDTAAVIVEPIQGIAGAVDLEAGFLHALRARCSETGALLILDEVQCGMGRTGYPFAADYYGVAPDLLTTAKSLGGGFPCGAVLMTDEVRSSLELGDLGTTFGGGPLACAAICAVIQTILRDALMDRVRMLSARIRETCQVGPVTDIQGAGFLLGLRTTRAAKAVQAELLEQDILVGTSADSHVIRLLPPYILDDTHVAMLASALSGLTK